VRVQGAGRPERGDLGVLLCRATATHVNGILSTSLGSVKNILRQVIGILSDIGRAWLVSGRHSGTILDEMRVT
jgi:hypothetical protein